MTYESLYFIYKIFYFLFYYEYFLFFINLNYLIKKLFINFLLNNFLPILFIYLIK